MSKVTIFKSVVHSTMSIIVSRNFDYKGYWFPGFLSKSRCNYRFNLFKDMPDNKIERDCVVEVKRILKNQIKAHNLEAYKIDYVILNFVNIDDEIYNYYGRQCKKIEVELELKLESGKVFKTNDVLYADSHSALREYKRAN